MGAEQAAELRALLTEFAYKTTPGREHSLFLLTVDIHQKASLEAVEELVEGSSFNGRLAKAVERASKSEMIAGGNWLIPWAGGYTVVALDREGHIVGACSNPQGRVYQEYGDNLYPPALQKAAIRMHLERAEKKGGLENLDNSEYIKGLGLEHLYLGEASFEIEGRPYYIGASGCELAERYIRGLLPPSMYDHLEERLSVDFLAGQADTFFANLVAGYIQLPADAPGELVRVGEMEPQLFKQFRISH